jgi:hypothetical protein
LLLSSLVPSRKQPHLHKDGHFHSTLSLSPLRRSYHARVFYNLAAIVSMRRCAIYLRLGEHELEAGGVAPEDSTA